MPINHIVNQFFSVSSAPVSWCVGILSLYGCRRIIQVDAAHWWWFHVKRFECLEKRYINVMNYYYY